MACDTLTSNLTDAGRPAGAMTSVSAMASATFCRTFSFIPAEPHVADNLITFAGDFITTFSGDKLVTF